MSWWDYGYQITAMANRTILVDNNTWNNTHISRVGQAMASTEDKAYEIMRELDVNYVLVIFGGLTGYASDGTCLMCLCTIIFPTEINIEYCSYSFCSMNLVWYLSSLYKAWLNDLEYKLLRRIFTDA